MKQLSGLLQFIVGFFLGVFVLAAGTTAVSYVIFTKMSANPPKPLFAEEKPKKPQQINLKKENLTPVKNQEKPEEKKAIESPKPSPSPETKADEKEKENLPAGAYKGKVTWSSGLSIRAEPNSEASRIGGVDYNSEIILLEQSSDGKWQKIRLSDGQEGWVKAGNVEKSE